jgi:hypothetical protein
MASQAPDSGDPTAVATTMTMSAASTPALISTITGLVPGTSTGALSQAIHSVSMKSLVPYTLDMQSHNYTKWRTLFEMVLGRFNLLSHVESDDTHPDNLTWATENLLVSNWLHSKIFENLMDMCLHLRSCTARQVWVHIGNLFTGNNSSRAVHLECELHNLVQGEMMANDYCHKLRQLANSLADCDAPVQDCALVHQLIRDLNLKFSVLKTLLPLFPKFLIFVEARELILTTETSRDADTKRATETALLATGSTSQKVVPSPLAQPLSDCSSNNNPFNNNNYNYGGQGRGRGCGGGHGRGGRNSGHGSGGHNGYNNAPFWPPTAPWGSSWGGGGWRASWTGATRPGLLGSHPPAHAYQAYQPPPMLPPHHQPSWDTTGLIQALQAASLQQSNNQGDWYMDSGASSHMTSDQGNLTKYFPSLSHDSSPIVVGTGSRLPILGIGYTHLRAPNINFLLAYVLHTPSLVSNLIYVHNFTRDNWYSIEFDPFGFCVKDLITWIQNSKVQ